MTLNSAQFEALFTNAFGASPSDFGLTIDTSGDTAVGQVNGHTVDMLVVQGRAIEWRVDGKTFVPFERVYEPNDPKRAKNGTALLAVIAA